MIKMDKADNKWRTGVNSRLEELTILGAKQNSDIHYIKDTVDEIKVLVREQNGRVRWLEQQTTAIKSVGSFVALVFGSLIGWLYKGDA